VGPGWRDDAGIDVSASWSIIVALVGWTCGWLLAGRRRALAPTPQATGASVKVSVIVPARNEAARVPRLLERLQASEPPPHEIIVADDDSRDGTARVARQGGAWVVEVSPPPGWHGKPWACAQGAAGASGDVLLFLDADTEPSSGLVEAMGVAAKDGELVSAHPLHRIERSYERLSAGPAIAMRRDRYAALGGHAVARADIAEDLALARAADAAGIPVRTLTGGDLLTYRMYPEGVRTLVDGWSKNLAAGARGTPPLRMVATVLWVTGALQAPLLLLTRAASPWVALALWAGYAAQTGVVLRRIGRFGWVVPVLYPLALAWFVALFVRSCLLAVGGRAVSWRGRPVRGTTS